MRAALDSLRRAKARSRSRRSKSPASAASRLQVSQDRRRRRLTRTSTTSPTSTRSRCSPTAIWRLHHRQARPARRGLHAFESVSSANRRRRNAAAAGLAGNGAEAAGGKARRKSQYEFLPSAESILEEVVPTSFKVKLFKCFLDAAVSEQIARMVAMKSRHGKRRRPDQEPEDDYNRARQARSRAKSWKSSAASRR